MSRRREDHVPMSRPIRHGRGPAKGALPLSSAAGTAPVDRDLRAAAPTSSPRIRSATSRIEPQPPIGERDIEGSRRPPQQQHSGVDPGVQARSPSGAPQPLAGRTPQAGRRERLATRAAMVPSCRSAAGPSMAITGTLAVIVITFDGVPMVAGRVFRSRSGGCGEEQRDPAQRRERASPCDGRRRRWSRAVEACPANRPGGSRHRPPRPVAPALRLRRRRGRSNRSPPRGSRCRSTSLRPIANSADDRQVHHGVEARACGSMMDPIERRAARASIQSSAHRDRRAHTGQRMGEGNIALDRCRRPRRWTANGPRPIAPSGEKVRSGRCVRLRRAYLRAGRRGSRGLRGRNSIRPASTADAEATHRVRGSGIGDVRLRDQFGGDFDRQRHAAVRGSQSRQRRRQRGRRLARTSPRTLARSVVACGATLPGSMRRRKAGITEIVDVGADARNASTDRRSVARPSAATPDSS